MKYIHLAETDSTNRYIAQYLGERENVIVTADRQTAGRGTKGRSFLSDAGGVYLSALLFPDGLAAANSFRIMAHAAVSVCRTAEAFGLRPKIKWPNDVLAEGRKLAGILIENRLVNGLVDASIVGIGLNVKNDLSSLPIAVSMQELLPSPLSAERVRKALIGQFLQPSGMDDYFARVGFLGTRVRISEGEREYEALACTVLPDGRLEIEEGGRIRALSSAEIRLKV